MFTSFHQNSSFLPCIPTIARSLGGTLQSATQAVVFCPAHDNTKSPALSLSIRNSQFYYKCHAGCRQEDVLDSLIERGFLPDMKRRNNRPPLIPDRPLPTFKPRPKPIPSTYSLRVEKEEREKRMERFRLAANSFSDDGFGLVHNYIQSRGLPKACPSLDIGACKLFPTKQKTKRGWYRFPAMIAKIRDFQNSIQGYEVHFLQPDGRGKAPLEVTRKIYGSLSGGRVWMREPLEYEGVLWLCEGVMNGLALQLFLDKERPGDVVCACLSSQNITNQVLPPNTKKLFLAFDHDKSGIQATQKALNKFKNQVQIHVRFPPIQGKDWLDCLKGKL